MEDREKLEELLCKVQDYGTKNTCEGWSVTVECKDNETIADHLIAHGVTVQEWISVKERLPEEEGLYLVAVVNDQERRYSKTAWYHGHGNWFLHQKVTHWQYLPQPPKGE